jgi:DegV family protein with EDD domain
MAVNKPERKLYKIGYLTKRLGITPRTIRYYDQMGLLPHVKRSEGNVRLFDDEDLEIIKKVRRMQKEEFLPLDVIKERLFGVEGASQNHNIAVLTDSTAVFPKDLSKNLNIYVIPIKLTVNGKVLDDDGKISEAEFWKKVDKGKAELKTTPPTVEEFKEKFLALKKMGIRNVYSIHLSNSLSDTFQNAQAAGEQVSDQMDVVAIDSKTTGAGLGLFVIQVAESLHKGESVQQLEVFIAKQIPLIYYTTMVNELRYLAQNAKEENLEGYQQPKLVEKLYQFKPIFTLKNNGEIDIIDCVKTQEEAFDILVGHIEQEYIARGKYAKYIMLTYNYLYGEAVEISNRIRKICPNTQIYLEEGCTALTTYLGPETLSVSIA